MQQERKEKTKIVLSTYHEMYLQREFFSKSLLCSAIYQCIFFSSNITSKVTLSFNTSNYDLQTPTVNFPQWRHKFITRVSSESPAAFKGWHQNTFSSRLVIHLDVTNFVFFVHFNHSLVQSCYCSRWSTCLQLLVMH